ncbi:MAG: DUF5689 domain-containing protein [Prevotellaceae bacterium]|jgi:hypothetical protein|nr:DUF5689 domain-containing protein [Prevotellaceae bacterium]
MNKTVFFLIALLALTFAGCEKQYDEPVEWTPASLQANMTVKELKALCPAEGKAIVNAPDAIVAGKVISTDKYGNFYRTLYIQDETSGIEIKIGKTTLYNTYRTGQTLYLKPHQLCLGTYGGMVSIGLPSADAKYNNSWIDVPLLINTKIIRGDYGEPVAPQIINHTADITADTYGTLVTINNLVYQSGETQYTQAHPEVYPITTWAVKTDPDVSEDDSRYGIHTFDLNGTDIVVRTSGYAKFADTPVPFVTGDRAQITGVLTRYNSTIQLVLNTDKDAVKP